RRLVALSVAAAALSVFILSPVLFTGFGYVYEAIPITAKFLGFLGIALLVGLFIKQKNIRKMILYSGAGMLLLIQSYLGTIVIFSTLLGTGSEIVEHWKIDSYRISFREIKSWAGPSWRQYYLEEFRMNGMLRKVVSTAIDNDGDCIVEFKEITGSRQFIFDSCAEKLTVK
ncbi:MAG: hypothetical protein KDD04_10560, partial [Sinomicrobium sp.]|nr:hypothetical protein [Sinomicrobium sp.]